MLLLTGLAPDAQLHFVLMVMGQFPDPRLMPRFGLDRRFGFLVLEFRGVDEYHFFLHKTIPAKARQQRSRNRLWQKLAAQLSLGFD